MRVFHHRFPLLNGCRPIHEARDPKSRVEFTIGVPVIAHLLSAFNSHIALYKMVFGFLAVCASSRTILNHFTVNSGVVSAILLDESVSKSSGLLCQNIL